MKSYPLIFLLFVMKNIKLERRYELTEAADVAQWSHTGNTTCQLLLAQFNSNLPFKAPQQFHFIFLCVIILIQKSSWSPAPNAKQPAKGFSRFKLY